MKAKEYLKEVQRISYKVQIGQEELRQIYNQMQGMQAVNFEPKVGGGESGKSPQEKLIFKFIEYRQKLDGDIEKMLEMRKEAIEKINKLSKKEYVYILYHRYLLNQKWEQIAIDLDYTYRQITNLHGEALKNLEDFL